MAQKVAPGQSIALNPLLTNSATINGTLAATDYYQRHIAGGKGVRPPARNIHQPFIVMVQNNSGGNLARGKVLQLGSPLLTDLDNDYLWFAADTPADPIAKCCLLRHPLPAGETGAALIAGACIASINVSDADHTHATPVDGETDLASGQSGLFEILTPLDGTGVQEAAVRWMGGSGSIVVRGRTDASHAKGASGTIRVYNGDTDTGETIDAVNDYASLESGKKCHAARDANGIYYLIAGEC